MNDERIAPLILVADDDEDILMLVEMVLEEDGYEVISASDGERALQLALDQHPDLCLLDVMMPRVDGCDVTRAIRASSVIGDTPIILLSARTQWEAVQRGRHAGADEYVTKPFVAEDLQRSVRSLLADSREPDLPAGSEPLLELVEGGDSVPVPSGGPVLVASLDQNLVKLVSYRLELGGYEVANAYDGAEAVQMAGERPPALCVADASIPEIAGLRMKRVQPPFSVQELFEEVEEMLGAPRPAQTA